MQNGENVNKRRHIHFHTSQTEINLVYPHLNSDMSLEISFLLSLARLQNVLQLCTYPPFKLYTYHFNHLQ
jgi:hypothetical protein